MNGASRAGQRPVSQLTEINRIEPNLPEYRRTTSQTRAYLDTTPKYFNINQQFYLLLHCLMIISGCLCIYGKFNLTRMHRMHIICENIQSLVLIKFMKVRICTNICCLVKIIEPSEKSWPTSFVNLSISLSRNTIDILSKYNMYCNITLSNLQVNRYIYIIFQL